MSHKDLTAELKDEEKNSKQDSQDGRANWVTGFGLIALGALFLVGQWVDTPALGLLILPVAGLIFMLWGVATRQAGLMIPGGILSGIGLGTLVLEASPLPAWVGVQNEGGLFMLAFALGWASIVVMTAVFTDETHWWPLIPGGIMALIGTAVLTDGVLLTVLGWLGSSWPLVLIAVGVYLLIKEGGVLKAR